MLRTVKRQIIGNYVLEQALASGSFGRVYRGRHCILATRTVAIKLLHESLLSSQQEQAQFLHEAKILEGLKHPGVLPLLDVGIHEGTPYIVMQFVSGGSLRQRMQQIGGPLPLEEALKMIRQLAETLQYVHDRGIVHRDLKPENILLTAEGKTMLADFGIATVLQVQSLRRTRVIGTPAYMAPEQFRGQVSKESDQYALGCIAYELVTGRRTFEAADLITLAYQHVEKQPLPPGAVNALVPERVSQAILKALAKRREERHATVMAFAEALGTGEAGEKARQWVPEGEGLARQQCFHEALAVYEQPIRINPIDEKVHCDIGITLPNLKSIEEELENFVPVIRLNRTRAYAHSDKGTVLIGLQRYKEALEVCDQAIGLDPADVGAYRNKGTALLRLKRYEEALDAYEQAIRLDPADASVYRDKGTVLFRLKRYEEALVAYEQAIHLCPMDVSGYLGKGATLIGLKRLHEALNTFEQATHLNPTRAESYYDKGWF